MSENLTERSSGPVVEKPLDKIKAHIDQIEAGMKVTALFFLVIFLILALYHIFGGLFSVIFFNVFMWILLAIILSLSGILFAIKTMAPESLELKKEKTLTSVFMEMFTHIIALLITAPLIVATFILLLSGSNHSEELTFISGLLGVIVGFYFGHRGVLNAEIGRNTAFKQKEKAEGETVKLKSELKEEKEKIEVRSTILEKFNKEMNRWKKKCAWIEFTEVVKEGRKDFKGVEHFNQYSPWYIPEEGWNEKENELLEFFEEHWESYVRDEAQLEVGY